MKREIKSNTVDEDAQQDEQEMEDQDRAEKLHADNKDALGKKIESVVTVNGKTPTMKARKNKAHPNLATGPGSPTETLQTLSDLTTESIGELLVANEIVFGGEKASLDEQGNNSKNFTVALSMDGNGQLLRASHFEKAVVFEKLRLQNPHFCRDDHTSYNYHEQETQWNKQTIGSGTAGGAVPLIFSLATSYQHMSDETYFRNNAKTYFQHSLVIPKANVIFDAISLDQKFKDSVEEATKKNTGAAEAILNVLHDRGQFVAKEMFLGGRLTISSSIEFDTLTKRDVVLHHFKSAASATIKKLDVEGSAETKVANTASDFSEAFRTELRARVIGGDPAAASTKKGDYGKNWICTLGKSTSWQMIGFGEGKLILALDLLSEDMRKRCRAILKEYFVSNLKIKKTELIGNSRTGNSFDLHPDAKKIVKIFVRYDRWIDAITTWSSFKNTPVKSDDRLFTNWYGSNGNDIPQKNNVVIDLEEGESLASIEVAYSQWIDKIAFTTTKGRRYPAGNGFYGNPDTHPNMVTKTVEASGVVGLYGNYGSYLDNIGLVYQELDSGILKHRAFLFAIEPWLFMDSSL